MRAILLAFFAVTCGADAFGLGSASRCGYARSGSTTQRMTANNNDDQIVSRRGALSSFLVAAAAAATSGLVAPTEEAQADGSRRIGQISGSGLVFKDTLVVESFDDPKVKGVTLYISNFERPLTERLSKDFFTEPSQASVTCVKNGKQIEIADNIDKSERGEPVFEEKRSILFKELRVQRIYDVEKNTIVYVSFNTRLDKNSDSNKSRFASAICAVSLD